MIYYFLKEDFDELNRKIYELVERLKDISLEFGRDCQEDRGIFTFEEGERQKQMLSVRLRELIKIKNNAKIIIPNRVSERVSIGKRVTLRDETSGMVKTYNIGSYMVLINKENAISYDTPIARLLIGAQVGEVRNGEIAGEKQDFRILKIE